MRLVFVSALILAAGLSCRDSTAPRPVAASLEIESGADQQATVATELSAPLVARVLDGGGKPVKGQPVTFRVTAGGGSLLAGTAVSNEDGIVQNRWTLGTKAGVQTVEAQMADQAGGALLVVAVFQATAHADAPDTVRVVSGNGQTAAGRTALPDSLLVRVVDRFGNPTPGATIAWTVSPNGGTLDHASGVTSDSGYSSVKLVAGIQAGDYTVVATAGARSVSFVVHVTRAAWTVADLVGVYPLTTINDQPVPFVYFQPSERKNVVLSGSLEILADGSTIRTESVSVTDFTGTTSSRPIERGTLVIKGDSVFVAAVPGVVTSTGIRLSRAVSAAFPAGYTSGAALALLPPAGPGVSLEKVSGDGQSGTVAAPLADPLIVRVLDLSGRPVAGQTVRFSVTSGGGSVPTQLVATGADGLAQTRWTMGTNAAAKPALTATIVTAATGVPQTVQFAATAVAGPAARIFLIAGGDVGHIVVGDTIRLTARALDQFDNDLSATLAFESQPAGVLSLLSVQAGSALFRAQQPGAATVTIRAATGGVTRSIQISSDSFGQVVFPVTGRVETLRRSGTRLVGIGASVAEWNGQGFTQVVPGPDALLSIDASDDGRFWINGAGGWFSDAPGTWSSLPPIPGPTTLSLAVAAADRDHVFTSVVASDLHRSVYQLVGGAWAELPISDSTFQGMDQLASPDPMTLLVFGALKTEPGAQYRPAVIQWTNGSWSQVPVPPLPAGWTNSRFSAVNVDHRGGPVFGLLVGNVLPSGQAWEAFQIQSGVFRYIDPPALEPNDRFVNIGRTSANHLVLVSTLGWWVLDGDTWTQHRFLNGWTALVGNGVVVDADGTSWFGVSSGGQYGIARITQP